MIKVWNNLYILLYLLSKKVGYILVSSIYNKTGINMKGYIKKLLRESLIREDLSDDEMNQLKELIKSGQDDNIELAYAIGEGQGIDVDEMVKSIYGDLLDILDGDTIKEKIPGLFSDELDLYGNGLEMVPESIGYLTNLKRLDLGVNKLESIPKSIRNLTNLKDLYLDTNQLKSLPDWIRNITNLKELFLHTNQLKSLPKGIGNLKNLEHLTLGDNQLESLPDWIGNLTNLEKLNLENNKKLSSLPKSIGNLKNLKHLYLEGNPLSGEEKERIEKLLPNTDIYF